MWENKIKKMLRKIENEFGWIRFAWWCYPSATGRMQRNPTGNLKRASLGNTEILSFGWLVLKMCQRQVTWKRIIDFSFLYFLFFFIPIILSKYLIPFDFQVLTTECQSSNTFFFISSSTFFIIIFLLFLQLKNSFSDIKTFYFY